MRANPSQNDEALRVLMLEDDPNDAALVQRALAKTLPAATVRWSATREDFVAALETFSPQIVLSDYRLETFDGLSALALVRAWEPATPFILVTGTIGEEMVVEALKSGVTDYVLKDRLERLELVLARALRERAERRDLLTAEAALRESQAQLQQSQKMEALGRLSGGVAHDFNNILTAIIGYAEFALLNPTLEEGPRADLKEILDAAFRAAGLTRQLLAFSRRQIFAPKVLDLNQTLTELDRMLQRIIGEDIKMTIATAVDLRHVRVDADQIGQVILNLVVNARDAMPKGGSLAVRTANASVGPAELHAHPDVRPGHFVELSVADSGMGMSAETMSRIFEPFFTTKCNDTGTGLGLATVYGIVKQSNGFIKVESSPSSGSVFRIYLPAADGALDVLNKAPVPESLKGSETILLVEDDAVVALVSRRLLEKNGYAVIEARGGEEALRLCADPARRVDLMLSDVVMAEMGGPELAERMRSLRPECRILFASGYAEGGITELSATREHFIPKPFSSEDLLRKVRQLLDAPAP